MTNVFYKDTLRPRALPDPDRARRRVPMAAACDKFVRLMFHEEDVPAAKMLQRDARLLRGRTPRGEPVGIFIAKLGLLNTMDVYLDMGGDVRVTNPRNGNTMLHALCDNDGDDAWGPDDVAHVLDRGANVFARTCEGRTALHAAAQNCPIETVKLLVERGANIDAVDELGVSPVVVAAHWQHWETLTWLLDRGASPFVPMYVDGFELSRRAREIVELARERHRALAFVGMAHPRLGASSALRHLCIKQTSVPGRVWNFLIVF